MEEHVGEKVARGMKSRTSPDKRGDKENVKPRLVHEVPSKREFREPTCEVAEHQIVYSENLLLKE
jgi:hypothetical protein